MRHSLVFCDGYQDRAFVGAWLDRMGCKAEKDNKRLTVVRGAYVKCAPTQKRVVVAPTDGYSKVSETLKSVVKTHGELFDRCLVLVDADDQSPDNRRAAVEQMVQGLPGLPAHFEVLCWVPRLEQHLEDVLRGLHPERFAAIDKFLDGRPEPGNITGKEAAFTFCSAWKTDAFGEAFFHWIWTNDKAASLLEGHLQHVRTALQRLLGPVPNPPVP